MKLIPTTLLALLMAGATCAQAKDADRDGRTPTEQEELAIAALEGLMAQSPERALPILKRVMAGNQSTVVKRRALFVLSQVGSPEARDILMQTARSTNPELRGEAIRSIGISGDPKSLDALQDVYKAGDSEIKGDILQAWMIAGRRESVYQAALNAKTEEEASDAVRMLGVMGATEELRKLGDRPNAQAGLLEAFAISGDLAGLRKIVDGKGDHQLRVDAVQRIGIINTDAARAALREIYASTTDEDMKEAALHGMLIAQDEKGVLSLYRAAKTTDEKRSLLRMLSMMNGDAALEAIDAALETK
jgi:HEAT repeat protein